MKVKMLDQPIVMIDRFTNETETVWYTNPVTEEEAKVANSVREQIIDKLGDLEGDQAVLVVAELMSKSDVETTDGKPWTIRQAVISAMYANKYANIKKDKQGNPEFEKEDVVANMHSIGHAFQHAPKMGFVEVDAKESLLIRRKMFELPVPGVVAGEVNRYFDQLEDDSKKRVVFGIDDEDKVRILKSPVEDEQILQDEEEEEEEVDRERKDDEATRQSLRGLQAQEDLNKTAGGEDDARQDDAAEATQ